MNEQVKAPWAGWEVTKTLGSGSFGKVYEIRDMLGTVTKAAMKVISVPKEANELNDLLSIGYDKESIMQRFLDELNGIAKEYNMMNELKGNANIIYCEDIFYEAKPDGLGYDLYIRMELLEPIIKAVPNPAPEESVIRLGLDMCNALSACKKHKIIHRDIKPSNILVSTGGNFKLGDFGVSKTSERTAGGTKTGTYGFMAPEVYNNQPYNASVDIYSLGMVMYWMLNRRCGPFLPLPPTIPMANQIDEAKQRRFNGESLPPPADGSESLKAIVLKACEFDTSKRFSSPEELAAELEKLKYGTTVSKSESTVASVQQSEMSQYDSSSDERTMGNDWGYTDEATQGTQYGGEEIEIGGTVGGDFDRFESQNKPENPTTQPSSVPIESSDNEIVITCPMPGRVSEVCATLHDHVKDGDPIIIFEAWGESKAIAAPVNGKIIRACPSKETRLNFGDIITVIRKDDNKVNASAGSKYDVTKVVEITREEASNGILKTLQVEGNECKLIIPKGVMNGEVLRFEGEGKADFSTGAKGTLIVTIRIKDEDNKEDFWEKKAPEQSLTKNYEHKPTPSSNIPPKNSLYFEKSRTISAFTIFLISWFVAVGIGLLILVLYAKSVIPEGTFITRTVAPLLGMYVLIGAIYLMAELFHHFD